MIFTGSVEYKLCLTSLDLKTTMAAAARMFRRNLEALKRNADLIDNFDISGT